MDFAVCGGSHEMYTALLRSIIDGELLGANVHPPHNSLEQIFLGHLEVVLWEIDG